MTMMISDDNCDQVIMHQLGRVSGKSSIQLIIRGVRIYLCVLGKMIYS